MDSGQAGIAKSERIAIVGGIHYPDLEAVAAFVRTLAPGVTVVSGGAAGVDRAAVEEARACGLAVIEHLPEWDRYGRSAGPRRNTRIVRDADRIVAFWDGQSRGTKNTIEQARRAGKPVQIIP